MDPLTKILLSQPPNLANTAAYWTGVYLDHGIGPGEVTFSPPISGSFTPPSSAVTNVAIQLLTAIEQKEKQPIAQLPDQLRTDYMKSIAVITDQHFVGKKERV
jgi:hypothetical protein